MDMDIRLEEAELSGEILDELIRLSKAWEAENSCYGYRGNEESDIRGNRIFLAYQGDRIAGYLFGHREKTERSSSIMPEGTPYFEVEEIYVCPECRGRGIGRQLFGYAEKAVADEAEYMMLTTATRNWRAILHFYIEELGMTFWSARLFKRI